MQFPSHSYTPEPMAFIPADGMILSTMRFSAGTLKGYLGPSRVEVVPTSGIVVISEVNLVYGYNTSLKFQKEPTVSVLATVADVKGLPCVYGLILSGKSGEFAYQRIIEGFNAGNPVFSLVVNMVDSGRDGESHARLNIRQSSASTQEEADKIGAMLAAMQGAKGYTYYPHFDAVPLEPYESNGCQALSRILPDDPEKAQQAMAAINAMYPRQKTGYGLSPAAKVHASNSLAVPF